MKKYRILLGAEIHLRIKSKRKLFSICRINNFDKFDVAIPGIMPNLNKSIINKTVNFLGYFYGAFSKKLTFFRKCYLYPDLPKGYQITQKYMKKNSFLIYFTEKKNISLIKNFHVEEDTAGIKYKKKKIELNFKRSGNPLLEIVTYPCFSNIKELIFFIKTFRIYCLFHKYSLARMEKGELKFDINISVIKGKNISKRIEIKNLNSFRNANISVRYETYRLIKNINKKMETRSYKDKKTIFLRDKEKYVFLKEFDLKEYKIKETNKNVNFINIISNFAKSFNDITSYFKLIKKKVTKKRDIIYKKKKIENTLLNNIMKKYKVNKKYVDFIVGKYIKSIKDKNINFLYLKEVIKKKMKERDLNP
ncbi:hypothetical protein ACWNYO_00265 [Candidatus Vidania fulgoroideorum]